MGKQLTKSSYFSDVTIKCLNEYVGETKSPRVAEERWAVIRGLCNFCEKDFFDLDGEDVDRYFSTMYRKVQSGGLKMKTVNIRKSVCNTFTQFVMQNHPEYSIPENWFLNLPSPSIAEGISADNIPSLAEIDLLLGKAKEEPMFYLILTMAFRCALTASEIVGILRSNVQTLDGVLCLRYPKTATTKERAVELPSDVAQLLVDYMSSVEQSDSLGHIFFNSKGNPLTIRNLDFAVERLLVASGVGDKYTLQDLRSRAILDMTSAALRESDPTKRGAKVAAVSNYVDLKGLRLNAYIDAVGLVRDSLCPANFSCIRVINPAAGEDAEVDAESSEEF